MAHFNFENMLSEVTKMDAPINSGPMMRWQRKAAEAGINKLSVPGEHGGPLSPWKPKSATAKTPKTPGSSKTPKTPGKTPGKGQQNKPPSKTPSKTPGKQGQQDRFIPNRATTDVDLGHYAIMHDKEEEESPSKVQYKQHLHDVLNKGQNPQHAKILSFKDKAPKAQEGHINNLKVLYSSGKVAGPKATTTRQIPQQPERILDAPELVDDYYLNLLDWSTNNHLAVALGGAVYLWNASTGTIAQLCEMSSTDDYVSGVSWIHEGNIIAIGTNSGNIQLWDAGQQKLVRTMTGHASRVGSMSWNTYILSSGSRTGVIRHDDVRVAEHAVGHLNNHTQEVCGLSWSPDGRMLASGGNDNLLNIWDTNLGDDNPPIHTLTQHQAAVKALAWCPWQPQLLASGGGTADRHVRLWNVATGACLNATDTNSQVCSILWSKEYKELITGHGYSQNQLTIWKYPTMTKVADLTGHTARVLCLTMSPDGTTVASAAADETIRLWKCFAVDKTRTKTVAKPSKEASSSLSLMHRGIR